MRKLIIEKTVFTFDELSDAAEENARNWYRDAGMYDEWFDSVYETAKTAGRIMGIDIEKIYFSGFCSQGDGARFVGQYQYKAGWRKALKAEFGAELLAELTAIGDELQSAQRPVFYQATASTSTRGRYQHSGCMSIDVDLDECYGGQYGDAFPTLERDLADALRSFADWIYSQLESEHEWLNSDDQVSENIVCNEYEFDESGDIH